MAGRSLGRVLFLIPARGGSRRVPGKNLKLVAGIPLVGHAIRLARAAARELAVASSTVAVSTDDPGIGSAARAWGADVVIDRPAALATDAATSVDAALHALDEEQRAARTADVLVLLQPTSPLTDAADVLAGLQRFRDGAHSVVSVARRHPAAWHHSMDRVTGAVRSAGVDDAEWVLTGAFYIVAADRLRDERRFVVDARTIGQEVPPERSIDVDEPSDLVAAEGFAARRPVASVRLADRELGVGRPFVIAEAGVNHNGDPAIAHRLVDAAADAGADAVKFQTFEPGRLVAVTAPTAAYQRSAGEGAEQRSMLERLALAPDVWPELKAHATQRGILFLSTPFDDASAALLDRLDVAAFKVGSGELTNVPFLEAIARYGRPMLVSTGMAEMVEVSAAVDAVRGTGNADLVLLHCVSAYPARVEDANLRAMATMRAAFGTPTGWSDHTPGVELGLAAAALGAAVIEKHLTLDRSMRGPDHAASLEPREFRILVDGIAATVAGLGSGLKVAADAEQEIASVARRSLHWSRALDLGEVVRAEDLVALRPATGISPANREAVVGRRVAHRVEAGAAVVDADLEQPA